MANSDQGSATTVLFVDDEKKILSALRRLTADEEFAVITASGGEEALDILEKTPGIGLIVSDQQMPGLSGVELLEQARKRAPDALRIILTGASSMAAAIDAINRGGAYRFITKPWDNEELLLVLREAVERFRLTRENSRLAALVSKQHRELKAWNARLEQRVQEQTEAVQGYAESLSRELAERKRMDKALRKSNQKYKQLSEQFRVLFDAIPDPLLLLSPELKVIWGNRGAGLVFDLDFTDVPDRCCHDLWKGSAAPCSDCSAAESVRTGQVVSSQLKTADGRSWDVRFFPVADDGGEVRKIIVIYRDVSEKEARQAEVVRTGQLAALGELAAGVAHEINNPINGVINYAQILSNRSGAESQDGELARRIIREGERIAVIVKSLLSFARERQEDREPVPLEEILSETLVLVDAQLRKAGIRLLLEICPELPPVIALKQQIQQVFLNLISNARYALEQKYPGDHDEKLLRVRGEACRLADGPGVRIIFHDQGTGIPDTVIGKVMNPFFSTKPHDQGTGLGLSISHGIIDAHGGRMTIDSLPGEFTRVSIELRAQHPRGVDR